MNDPAAAIPARAAVRRFAWTHVRHALQQVVAVGASSPYFTAASVMRPFQTVCMVGGYPATPLQQSFRARSGTKFGTKRGPDHNPSKDETPPKRGFPKLPGLDSNQQPSG